MKFWLTFLFGFVTGIASLIAFVFLFTEDEKPCCHEL